MSSIKRSIEAETRFTALGITPSEPEARAYVARAIDGDFRKAEALSLSAPSSDPLQLVRTLLVRGDLAAASILLTQLKQNFESDPAEAIEICEVLLEQARLACFNADWQSAKTLSENALSLAPVGISQMTLRQVRSIALMELGLLDQAQREIETCLSLGKLYPYGTLQFYAESTELKIMLRAGKLQPARSKLKQLWANLQKSSYLNVDTVLVIVRAAIELKRLSGEPVAESAYLSWVLSSLTGDRLYAALAAIDIAMALGDNDAWYLVAEEAASKFMRIKKLLGALVKTQGTEEVSFPVDCCGIHAVVLIAQNIVVDSASLKVLCGPLTPQMKSAILALKERRLTKEEFFRKVWGDQKFVPHLHDQVIRTLLARLRKASGLTIVSDDNSLELTNTLVVEL